MWFNQTKGFALSYHNRNVAGLCTIEMTPGCGFIRPRKEGMDFSVQSQASKDDSKRERGSGEVGDGGAGEGAEGLRKRQEKSAREMG